jgi:molecular chaperone DnaK (HSP70)
VAKGAAIWGHWVSNRLIDARWSDAEEADVAGLEVRESPEVAGCTAHGLGVLATRNNRQIVKILVQQNTATPFEAEETFYTDKDGATTVYVPLYEGESEEVESCNSIGSAKLDNVPSRPKGQAVKVKFKIDIAGRLEVRVKDVETQREEVKSVNRNVLRSGDSLSIEKDFETRRRHLAQLVIL